jgi:hypothetical protein
MDAVGSDPPIRDVDQLPSPLESRSVKRTTDSP